MQERTEELSDFTGVLVKRKYKPGQKYVQLVFETAEGMRLSVSRNAQMIRSLTVGEKYRVQGPEYALGDKSYIHEPIATLVQPELKWLQRHRRLAAASLAILVVSTAGGTTFALMHDPAPAPRTATNKTAPKQPIVETPQTTTQPVSETQAQPTATPVVSATKPKTSTKQSTQTTTPSTNSNNSAATTPAAQTPTDNNPPTNTTPDTPVIPEEPTQGGDPPVEPTPEPGGDN